MASRTVGVAVAAAMLAVPAGAADLDYPVPGEAPHMDAGALAPDLAPTPGREPVGINVILNHAKVLKLSRPASTIVIGNPEIADATVEDATTIVLTGQGFGRTNLVILDQTGEPIFDEKIAVTRDQLSTLRVYRRANIETLSCEPYCEAAYLTPAEIQSARERAEVNTLFD